MISILRDGPMHGRPARVQHGMDWYVVHTRDANLVYRWCPLRGEYLFDSSSEGTAEDAYELHSMLNARD